MSVRPVALDATDATRHRTGDLVWIGGIEMVSRDPAFGGFSALHVARDDVTLLSDGGNIVRFRLDRGWRVSNVRFANLPGGPGPGWQKKDRDSESMSIDRASGAIWVGFENTNALWRYTPDFSAVEAHIAPSVMRLWPDNQGPEAMTLLPRGGMVVIDETTPWPHAKGRAAIRFQGDPVRQPRVGMRFAYMPPAGYDPSDMAVMPDGRWLMLDRHAALPLTFSVKLSIVDPATVKPGALVRGREIATLAAPLIHDNFEGVAVTREGNATMIWLVSDDNQLWLQRNLLLKFRLEPVATNRS